MGNPFMAFAQQERKKIVAEDPSLKSDIGKVGKLLGERWRKLTDAEKAKYKTMTLTKSKTKKSSKKSRKVINESETPESTKKGKKSRKGTRKLSGYMKFVKGERARLVAENPKMKSDIIAVGKEMGKRWRALSETEKASYA